MNNTNSRGVGVSDGEDSGYERPDGTRVRKGYGLFSREAKVNKDAFLIHHYHADMIVVDEKTGIPVRAEYHFHDPTNESTNRDKGGAAHE